MKLEKLVAKNFKNYHELELDFNKIDKVNMIIGKNGLGKSTILDALCFAFFGETLSGLKGNDIINRGIGKDTLVSLVFNQGKHTFKIERYRKDTKNKNKVLLYEDDNELTFPAIKATNDFIIKILGFDLSLFKTVVAFNSSSSEMFINATDKSRKDFLEKLLHINLFDKSLDLTKDKIKEDNNEKQQLDEKYNLLTSQLGILKQSETLYQNQKDVLLNNQKQANNNYQNLLSQQDNIKEIKQEDITKQSDKLSELHNKLSELSNNNVQKEYQQISRKLQQENNNSQKIMLDVKHIKEQMKDLKDKIDKLNQSKNPVCEYCGSVLDNQHKEHEIGVLMNQGKSLKKQVAFNREPYKASVSKIKEYQSKLDKLEKEVTLNQDNIKELTQSINQEQDIYNSMQQEQRNYELFNEKLSNAKSQLDNINQQINNLEEQYQAQNKENGIKSDNLDKEIKEINDKIESLNTDLDILKDVKDLFSNSGLKNMYIDNALPLINEHIKKYLDILSNETIGAMITTEKKTKQGSVSQKVDIMIDYPSRGEGITFQDLSSGEKRIVSLSIMLAFNQYFQKNNHLKILLLDEVFDTLSDNRIDNVFKLLNQLENDYDYIFVISHLVELKANHDFNVLPIKNNGMYSTLVIK